MRPGQQRVAINGFEVSGLSIMDVMYDIYALVLLRFSGGQTETGLEPHSKRGAPPI